MKKFSYLFFALALLALACRPSSAAPSSVNVNDCDIAGHGEYLLAMITCNSQIDDPNLSTPTYRSTVLKWTPGNYHKSDGYQSLKTRAENAAMPADPEGFFGDFIPKAWTGPVSIDVYCHLKLRYAPDDADRPAPTIEGASIEDNIIKFATPDIDFFKIAAVGKEPNPLPLLDFSAQVNKIIAVTQGGKTYDFDADLPSSGKNTTTSSQFAPMELNVNEDFPLTLYTISIRTLKHNITVAGADDAKGMITPGKEQQVNQGEDSSFVVVANDGYRIAKLLIDGEPVAIDSKFLCGYTFKQVEKPHSLEAVFEEYTTAPSASADMGLTATLVDVLESKEDKEVADFETLGFVSGGQNVNIVSADGKTKTGGTFTAGEGGFVQAVKLAVKYEEGAESKGLTLTVKPTDAAKPFSADKSYHALLLNKTTNYYDLYPATLNADGNLTMTIKPVGDYFSTGTIFVYSGTAKETGDDPTPVPEPEAESKSSGGCAAGIGALALLALAPLYLRRKR